MNAPKTPPVWLSETDVRSLVLSARKAKDSLVSIIAGIDAKVAARRDELNKNLSELPTSARLAAIDTAASTVKATLKAESNKPRTEILRSLARMNEQAKGAIPFWDNAVHVLLRQTIASAKRTTIFSNLAAAGPVELKAFSSLAIATKDADMASAVVGRLHEIAPSSARPVSPRAVADALVGELQREMMLALLEVDSQLQEAVLSDRLFESGNASGTNAVATVAMALKKRRLAEVGGARVEDEADAE
jgi:hypothetical protein